MNFIPGHGIFASVHTFPPPKLHFIDSCNHVRLVAHALRPMPLSPKRRKGLWNNLSPLTDTAIISKLELKAHLLLVSCIDFGSQVMQCNKHVLWLAVVVLQGASVDCSSQKDCRACQMCMSLHRTDISMTFWDWESCCKCIILVYLTYLYDLWWRKAGRFDMAGLVLSFIHSHSDHEPNLQNNFRS